MTILTGSPIIGVRGADGHLVALAGEPPAAGAYIIGAQARDAARVALAFNPLNALDQAGFAARTADGERAGLTPTIVGPTCYAAKPLGYGLECNLYPPVNVALNVTYFDAAGADAFLAKYAGELAGRTFGSHQPTGINRAFTLSHRNDSDVFPFSVVTPHHTEGGGMDLDLRAEWLYGANVFQFCADPEPFLLSRRYVVYPGPCHFYQSYWQWTPVAPTMGLPMDVRTELQTYCALRATLTVTPPLGTSIRLRLEVAVVARVGKTADFNWAPPVKIVHPLGSTMDCLPDEGSLIWSGAGDCLACLPESDVSSLDCFCTCEAFDLSQCTRWLDMSINGLVRITELPACNPEHARYLREVALYGNKTEDIPAPWTWGMDPEHVTAEHVLSAFNTLYGGGWSTLSELVAGLLATEFGPLSLSNANNYQRIQTYIEAEATVTAPATEAPAELVGTIPLPTSDIRICFPGGAAEPTIARVRIANVDGYEGMMAQRFAYMLEANDVWAATHSGTGEGSPQLLDCLIEQYPWIYEQGIATTPRMAYRYLCHLWRQWLNFKFNFLAGLVGHEFLNLPLRTDCFPGGGGLPPGFDAGAGEYVFGWAGPGELASSGGRAVSDYAAFWTGAYTALDNPWRGAHEDEWRQIAGGAASCICGLQSYVPYCELFQCTDPDGEDYNPHCCKEPIDLEHVCEIIEPYTPTGHGIYHMGGWPRYFGLVHPQLEVRIGLIGCQVRVRVMYWDWFVRADTCWSLGGGGQPAGYWAERTGEYYVAPMLCSLSSCEIGRGNAVILPAGWSDETPSPGGFADGALMKYLVTRAIGTPRSLGGCGAVAPGHTTICSQGNAIEVYL